MNAKKKATSHPLIIQYKKPKLNQFPEVFGKITCSKFTGYSVNTLNKFICTREIPYYKRGGRVFFRKQEITDWLLNNRVNTVEEHCAEMEESLTKRLGGRSL